jgi:hypothetical protein
MNDFTLTDLTEIHRCLKYMTKGGITPYSCHTIALVKKVRTMIDTYSEFKIPTMADYCCRKCNEEWHNCECKNA